MVAPFSQQVSQNNLLHSMQNNQRILPSISKWKRVSEQWYEHDSKMFEDLLGSVRTRMVNTILASSSILHRN